VRPNAYLLIAAGQPLYAPTPEELAEIAEYAIGAGDRIELVRVRHVGRWRALPDREFERFLRALAARLA
jgi:hypothetical protein